MQRFIKIIVACFLLKTSQLEAQTKIARFSDAVYTIGGIHRPTKISPSPINKISLLTPIITPKHNLLIPPAPSLSPSHSNSHSLSLSPSLSPSTLLSLSPSYTTSSYAFFCRQELKWEKKTGIPFRFRLGSLEQSNKLENYK